MQVLRVKSNLLYSESKKIREVNSTSNCNLFGWKHTNHATKGGNCRDFLAPSCRAVLICSEGTKIVSLPTWYQVLINHRNLMAWWRLINATNEFVNPHYRKFRLLSEERGKKPRCTPKENSTRAYSLCTIICQKIIRYLIGKKKSEWVKREPENRTNKILDMHKHYSSNPSNPNLCSKCHFSDSKCGTGQCIPAFSVRLLWFL